MTATAMAPMLSVASRATTQLAVKTSSTMKASAVEAPTEDHAVWRACSMAPTMRKE